MNGRDRGKHGDKILNHGYILDKKNKEKRRKTNKSGSKKREKTMGKKKKR